jgi:N-formylglutamate deformylase
LIQTFVELLDEKVPLLAFAIHNGHAMHPELLSNCGISDADRLREEDPFTENFTAPYANKVIVRTSRFTVDLNRKRGMAVYQKPEDCWGLPVRKSPLAEDLLAELLDAYDGWYGLAEYTIRRLLEKNPFLLVLDLHSYNHRRQGPKAVADPQAENPDIILGRNNLPEQFYPWVDQLRSLLDCKVVHGYTLDCRIDVKFTGGNFSRWMHQTFPGQVACLAIEFKKIFMDEWTGALDKGFQNELASLLAEAVRASRRVLQA